MKPVSYAVETYAEIIDDLRPLLIEHWRELSAYPDIALDPDWSVYEAMDAAGKMAVYSVRIDEDRALVGYAVYFGRLHPHYKSAMWAVSDIFWLHPDYRSAGIGTALFRFIEADLASSGVAVMHTTFKKDHPAAGVLLESLGHAMVEIGYSKRIG